MNEMKEVGIVEFVYIVGIEGVKEKGWGVWYDGG